MKKTLLQVVALSTLLLVVYGANAYFVLRTPLHEAASIGKNVASFIELSDRFEKLANDKGAVYAFNVLHVADLPPNTDIHLLGHKIGDALYAQKGVAGMSDCTNDFRNACSHSIVIGALGEYGEAGALPLIHDACLKAPGGSGAYTMCYHGLGHGVFAYFGYDLSKTASWCEKTGTAAYQNQEAGQCIGGAIMELISGGGHDHDSWLKAQKYFTDDPLSPCLSSIIPPDAKNFCLSYVTPELWTRAGIDIGRPDPSEFPKAFAYCDAIPMNKSSLREACFGGFGKDFLPLPAARDIRTIDAYTNAQFEQLISWCTLAGPDDGKKYCLQSVVASVFWGGENNPDTSFRFCTLPTGILQDECYSGLAEQIQYYTDGQRKADLCNRLPERFKSTCMTTPSK